MILFQCCKCGTILMINEKNYSYTKESHHIRCNTCGTFYWNIKKIDGGVVLYDKN